MTEVIDKFSYKKEDGTFNEVLFNINPNFQLVNVKMEGLIPISKTLNEAFQDISLDIDNINTNINNIQSISNIEELWKTEFGTDLPSL